MTGKRTQQNHTARIPAGIWALGFGSLFMDLSSELIHSLLPVFMVTVLGASMMTVGVIEGIAEATAAFFKVFSGMLSDHLRKRKWLMLFGYGLAALTKPLFPMATSVAWVFGARFADRVGKGIRGAPRDALIADITPREIRGAAYGLRQALDSVGALLGPVLAVALMFAFADDIRSVLWVAVIPAVLCVLTLAVWVKEPEADITSTDAASALQWRSVTLLPVRYWLVVLLGGIFTLARFSEAFLLLRVQELGLSIGFIPLVLVVLNLVYAGAAYPAGAIADKVPARQLLLAGIGLLLLADLVLAISHTVYAALLGVALWGLHMAFTQGLLSKLVADTAPASFRATAFGLFNLVSGVALLLASVIAGAMWQGYGSSATFLVGAGFALIAIFGLMFGGKLTTR
jgi:MFS family permease